MAVYSLGIDVGSTSAEALLLEGNRVVAYSIVDTGYNGRKAADLAIADALRQVSASVESVSKSVATGYGRVSVEFADRQITEISCYARGINFLYPEVRTVIDIGGQDSKVIIVDKKGKAVDFAMNDKCAAGTGRFLDVTARALQLPLSQMGAIGLSSQKPAAITSMCTVFAESEVITLVAEGVERSDIVAGLHLSVARRIATMVKRLGAVAPIAFAGGVAKNSGVIQAIESLLNSGKLIIPQEPQIVGALGAALLARDIGLEST